MAEPLLSALPMLTEFFSTEPIEVSARRTGFVQRASKITGKLFLALVTFGPWSTAKTSLAQLAAKAGQLAEPVAVSPEAIHQRLTPRALAFLQEMIQRAFAKLHAGDTVCDAGLFASFTRVYIADSTGFGLPDTLKDLFPGAGGSARQAGAKIQLVWDYTRSTFAHFALTPWNLPDNKYIDTVVTLAQRGSLFLSELGYFKLNALAQLVAAHAYVLSRLNHQTTRLEAIGGHVQEVELARALQRETRLLLILLNYALCPSLRAALWMKNRRELSLLKLVRHLQAVADRWRYALFLSKRELRSFLHRAWASAERLVVKASRKRRTSAQILRESLNTQNDFMEFTAALAA